MNNKKLSNIIESYAAIVNISNNDIMEYAKAAIRDIFIQMPSRSVTHENWPGFKNQIIGFFGKESYEKAMNELLSEGWLSKGETRYEWKKMYPPVPQKKKKPLKEWADYIMSHPSRDIFKYSDIDAYPFIYDKDGDIMYLGNPKGMHKFIKTPPSEKIANEVHGRIWTNSKIISFWDYPETLNDLKHITDLLNIELKNKNINKIDSSWRMDVPITTLNMYDYGSKKFAAMEDDIDKENYDNQYYSDMRRSVESYLVPLTRWNPEMMKNSAEYMKEKLDRKAYHVMSPLEKYKKGLKLKTPGYGSERRFKLGSTPPEKLGKGYHPEDVPQFIHHQMANLSDSIIKESVSTPDMGCLMLSLKFPKFPEFAIKYINPDDIYNDASGQYGYETEPHVTILYGFENDVNVEDIKKIVLSLKNPIKVIINKIDIFSTSQFDVIKFNVESNMLRKLYDIMKNNFKNKQTFEKYSPHVTLAYVKKGLGTKYVKQLKKPMIFTSKSFKYSYPDGSSEFF